MTERAVTGRAVTERAVTGRAVTERAVTGRAVTQRAVHAANAARHADDLAREIRERHAGRTVAVVGHASTGPAIVTARTARPALAETDYGDVFVAVLPSGGGAARLLRLRVGG